MTIYEQRLNALEKQHESLLSRKNVPIAGNGNILSGQKAGSGIIP